MMKGLQRKGRNRKALRRLHPYALGGTGGAPSTVTADPEGPAPGRRGPAAPDGGGLYGGVDMRVHVATVGYE